jgi:O-antigen ligase
MAAPARGWPVTAVCLYALLIPFQPILTLPDGSPLRFAAADAVAPLIFLGALGRPARRLPSGFWLVVAAIPLLALGSTLLAARDRALSGYAIGKLGGLLYLATFALAAARCLPRTAELRVLRALAAGAFVSAALGLVGFAAWMKGFATELMMDDRLCSTMTGDPNIYCSLLAVGLLVTLADPTLSSGARGVRGLVIAAALVLTGSRSGAVGALVGIGVYLLVRARDPWVAASRGSYMLIAAGTAIAVLLLTDSGWRAATLFWEHLWRLFSVESRFALYERAVEQFTEHPILGLGVGGFWDLNTWYQGDLVFHSAVHNTYLWALVDLGVGGGLLVATLFAAGIGRCVGAARRLVSDSAPIVAGALATMAIFNLFIDGLYQRHVWVLLACALGMPAARRAP